MQLTPEEKALIEERRRKGKQPFFDWEPRRAEEYTVEEKVAAFNQLHESALAHYNGIKTGDIHEDNDDDHYIFEAVMELLSRPEQKVWVAYNKFQQ